MAKLTEQDFRKELSSGNLKNIYFIYGEEKYLVKKYTSSLINKAVGKNPSEFDFQKLSSNTSLEDIIASSEQLPVFSKYKCVCVNDYDINTMSESDYKDLEKYLTDLPENLVLIFSQPTLNENSKNSQSKDKKPNKTKRFVSAVEKYGTVLELQKKGDIALEKQLVSWAEKNGCTLTQINASKIIAMCGNDMTALKNEIDKLSAFADNSEITEEIIKKLVTKNTEIRVFEISNCISSNDFNGAYKNLHQLFEQNEKPEMILSALSSTFVDMYRMRVASESGKTASDVAKDFKYRNREFVLKTANNNARRYSTQTLRRILDTILQTDIKLKSTRSDAQILLETLISKLLIIVREGMSA
ncbi:MAG: DNA polymerase III subunit delta [Clostridia bacterium]|nr:DNA polymerase III subunit delta [Clostridia bacterium]